MSTVVDAPVSALRPAAAPPTRVAVLGCGHWGMNHVRVFSELPDATVVAVCDTRTARLTEVGNRYPRIVVTRELEDVLDMDDVEAVVVATEARTHHEIASAALRAGKHVLVEKPLATTSADARDLVALADAAKRLLVVGHTFLYNAAVRKVKEQLASDGFGRVYYVYARRTNLGPIRSDVNALWDLASHDIAIFNYLLDDAPTWVSAVGACVLGNGREDVGFISLGYRDGTVGHIHVSWADANKVREVVVVGSDRRIVFDDLDPREQVRVFFKGVSAVPVDEPTSFGEHQFNLRDGDILSPAVPVGEPLKHECGHFIHCIRRGEAPFTDGRQGLAIVNVMEAVDESIKRSGGPVRITSGPPISQLEAEDASLVR